MSKRNGRREARPGHVAVPYVAPTFKPRAGDLPCPSCGPHWEGEVGPCGSCGRMFATCYGSGDAEHDAIAWDAHGNTGTGELCPTC